MAPNKESKELLPSEAILWDILESVTDAVVTIDEDHRVLVCNQAAEEMFGYSRNEILGKDVSPLIPVPHREMHRSYVDRFLETGVPRVIGKARECVVHRRSGESLPVEISYSVSTTQGRIFFTAVIRDISKRKEMEREIRFMERLADVGKATAHIVHEIRKPLMLIGGFARQIVNAKVLENETKATRKLKIIVDEVKRLETLLNSIRLLTRSPTQSAKKLLLVNEILQETIDLLDPMIQNQRIELDMHLSTDSLQTYGDADQLKQVFLNLLLNSIEALKGRKGKMRVKTHVLSRIVQIVVGDNGPGIPPEVQDRIFDPFFTTKFDGTGLGLAISRNIIRDHGGSIKLSSTASHGTTFIVELPTGPHHPEHPLEGQPPQP